MWDPRMRKGFKKGGSGCLPNRHGSIGHVGKVRADLPIVDLPMVGTLGAVEKSFLETVGKG